ncbi:hypothetical protein LR48_Vigan325s000300 [Vigna angularis]|uniref:Uncharacterized protein n=1 Tax=Phaseolus angularis TaxID=3914 RepID=A0A0L9T8Y2_PHAAN|nr:hypothetical protein LR48_Vigan325s000300 [Vigna angularis]
MPQTYTTSRASHCSVFTSTSTRFSSFSIASKGSSHSAHIHTDDHCNDRTDIQNETTQGKTQGIHAPGWCGNWHSHQLPPEEGMKNWDFWVFWVSGNLVRFCRILQIARSSNLMPNWTFVQIARPIYELLDQIVVGRNSMSVRFCVLSVRVRP